MKVSKARRVAAMVAGVSLGVVGLAPLHSASADSLPQVSIGDVTHVEGNGGTTAFAFPVKLAYAAKTPVVITYATSDGSAQSVSDYAPTSGSVTINTGATTATITVPVNGDVLSEANEYFYLNLSSVSGAAFNGDQQGLGSIIDDDPAPYVSVGDTTVTEGDAGTVNAVFPITLSGPSGQTTSVRWYTSNSSAVVPTDYSYGQGTVTFAPGQTSASVSVSVNGDTLVESTEVFAVNLYDYSGVSGARPTGYGSIVNDDRTSMVSVLPTSVVEGNSGTSSMVFTVTLQPAATGVVTVPYYTSDNNAQAATDYQYTQGTLTFAPGTTSQTVTVLVNGDATVETDEGFYLNLFSVTGASTGNTSALGVIRNDDGAASTTKYVSISDAALIEGASGTANATFTVTVQPAPTATVTVNYATSDSSAISPTDYAAASGTLTFTAGQTSKTVSVAVNGDAITEADETFFMSLSSPVGLTSIGSTGYGRIINDDANPVMQVSTVAINEGDSGLTAATFTVSLSTPSANTVTANYTTADGSAVAGSDYQSAVGALSFAPGQTSKTVTVNLIGDTIREGNEYFYLNLSTLVNASASINYGVGYIVNDDNYPTITVSDPTTYEGQSGAQQATFTVSLTSASPNTVTVNYGTVDGEAQAGTDYVSKSGSLTFAPGITSQTVVVTVNGDTVKENNERFYLNLSTPVNADFSDSQGIATIIDDDVLPLVSLGPVVKAEGNSGTTTFTFPLTLSSSSPNIATVNYSTSDGSATVGGGDYLAATGTATFAANSTSTSISVTVNGDTVPEGDEYFYVTISAPVNAQIWDNQKQGIIVNDDQLPTLAIDSVAKAEGNSGTSLLTFTVTLAPASLNTVTVNYATSDNGATAGSDYVATSGTLTFTPGQTSQTIPVTVNGDATAEGNEGVLVSLSTPTLARVSSAQGYGVIVNDDPGTVVPTSFVSVSDPTVLEGNAGTVNASFTVTLLPASTSTVFVNYATGDNNAIAGSDYSSQTGTLVFAPGQTSKTVSIAVNGDTSYEGDESFSLSLSNVSGASYNKSSGYAQILNDDVQSRVSVSDAIVIEGNSGPVTETFTITVAPPSPNPIVLSAYTSDGSALSIADYAAVTTTVTIPAGQTTATVTVQVANDNLAEATEYYYLTLKDFVGTTYVDNQAYGIINDVDTFSATGKVLDGAGAGISGATITRTGNGLAASTTTSAPDGSFSSDNLPDGSYTITPTAPGTTFFPNKATANVLGKNVALKNFMGVSGTFMVGTVVDPAGKVVPNVTITRTGGGQPTATSVTNALGYWGFSSNPAGTYTLTATATGFSFNPAPLTVVLGATSSQGNLILALKAPFITGRVTSPGGAGIAGVTVTRTGGGQPTLTATTNAAGYFGFSNVVATAGGITYTLTPTKTALTFAPVSRTALVSTTVNASGVDFVGS